MTSTMGQHRIACIERDAENGRIRISDALAEMLQTTETEYSSLDAWTRFVAPSSRPAVVAELSDGKADGPVSFDAQLLVAGRETWFRLHGERHERGSVTVLVVPIGDLVEARETKAVLEKQLALFLAHTPAAIAMFDRDMRYIAVSEGWISQYQLEGTDVTGRSHYEVFPDVPDRWKKLHQRCLAGEKLRNARDRFDRADGSAIYIQWELAPWKRADGSIGGLVMFTQVITEQVENEAELERTKSAAEAANLAKSQFLANMSHEIRTPLNAILGFLEVLFSDDPQVDDDHRSTAYETIHRNSRSLLSLVDQVLDLSKIESGRVSLNVVPVDVRELIRDVRASFSLAARARFIGLDVDVDSEVPRFVLTDRERVRQVLVNLVGNALKFTQRGQIRIVARVLERVEGRERLAVDVVDTGCGIPEHARNDIFGAFNQVDGSMSRLQGGAGLGLRISRKIAESLDGRLEVDSTEGAGSTFTLEIPVEVAAADASGRSRRDNAEQAETEATAGSVTRTVPIRVLVAEDGPDNQRLLSHFLPPPRFELEIVTNGEAALEKISGATYDILVLDMQMPIRDGYSTARELRRLESKIPIIALTAHALEGDAARCLDAGCDEYLSKPFRRSDLIEMIDRLIAKD